MFIFRKKQLLFDIQPWWVGKTTYYVARLPRTDLLHLERHKSTPPFTVIRTVTIADFIMAHATNSKRNDAAYFVFKQLEWCDNICIRTAYELDRIKSDPMYSIAQARGEQSLRIVHGEIWTRVDYDIERAITGNTTCDRAFDDYPELDYDVLFMPPFSDPRDRVVTPLKFQGWNSSPKAIYYQLEPPKGFFFPDMEKLRPSGHILRM